MYPIDLGSAFMQEDGALVVLGGFGASSSPNGVPITDFANNSGWHDDVSDGSIDATVEIAGRSVPVLGAWLIDRKTKPEITRITSSPAHASTTSLSDLSEYPQRSAPSSGI